MSGLTAKEREGLEDIFLSIQPQKTNLLKSHDLLSLFITKNSDKKFFNIVKEAKDGLNRVSFPLFSSINTKKKKNLSK